jgi:hypothetical protein
MVCFLHHYFCIHLVQRDDCEQHDTKKKNGVDRSAVGIGKRETISKWVLVQIREAEIRFDQTSLGSFATAAVRDAINQLTQTNEFSHENKNFIIHNPGIGRIGRCVRFDIRF